MRFASPLLLLALLVVPVVVLAYLALERRPARYAVAYTNLDVLAAVVARAPRWRRYVPLALAILALTVGLVALARPELSLSVAREQASIALTLDVSGSMRAEDVKPSRLGAAQNAIRRFLDQLPDKYRVGLVTFAEEPYVAATLTRDRQLVSEALDYAATGRGTAIGDALARSVEVLRPATADPESSLDPSAPASPDTPVAPAAPTDPDSPLSAILLLSDGAQTRGFLEPLDGAERARSFGIPIYTIALGTPNGTVEGWGGMVRRVPPDPVTLRQIADTTGGEFFATQTEAKLNEVYEGLASKLGSREEWREVTFVLLGLAALLALGAGAAAAARHRLP